MNNAKIDSYGVCLVNDLYPLPPQMLKHTKTVCTHQVRECDYKDLGCTYKVRSHSIYSLLDLYNNALM